MHVAVLAGAAVTSAVLTGALLVGDSVRGSLRDLALNRLGSTDQAFLAHRFLSAELATRLGEEWNLTGRGRQVEPLLSLQGSVTHVDSGRRASTVRIHGVDPTFESLFESTENGLKEIFASSARQDGIVPLAINESLAVELQARAGDTLIISSALRQDVNPEFVLGRREAANLLSRFRAEIVEIVPDEGLGQFSLELHQGTQKNVFLPLPAFQRLLDAEGSINTILISGPDAAASSGETTERTIQNNLSLEDYGLKIRESEDHLVLESREMIISPELEDAIGAAAAERQLEVSPVMTYLANRISSEQGSVPYSTITAMNVQLEENGVLTLRSPGATNPGLAEDQILLNAWTAAELGVSAGDQVEVTYYTVSWDESLSTKTETFEVAGVVKMQGLALDQTLAPSIPGIEGARSMSDWDPPVPIDLSQIRPVDEDYWEEYRTAPKAFVSYTSGAALWQSRFGKATSLRFRKDQLTQQDLEASLTAHFGIDLAGSLLPVRDRALSASTGATDFGMLFIGFSLFLIVSAVILVALLFRLGVEYRSHEVGLLLAAGFPASRVRNRFLSEGALLASCGALLGLIGGLGYASLLVTALRTIWVTAVGSAFLQLHIGWSSLLAGLLISVLAILGSIAWTMRDLVRRPATTLLARDLELQQAPSGRGSKWVLATGLLGALAMTAAIFWAGLDSSTGLFFGLGTSLLLMGMSAFSLALLRTGKNPINPESRFALLQTSFRNAARNRGRSILSLTLIACASFVIVAVGANRTYPGDKLLEHDSGGGGFALKAESDVPLVRDLDSADALYDLGFSDQEIDALEDADVISYRLLPGEDMSCRNLYQPGRPRVLGVPSEQIERGGFRFQSLVSGTDAPWTLLDLDLGPDVVPAFGDANSVLWILHKGMGDDVVMTSDSGEEIRLKLVGLLSRSIFQSELLISNSNFQKYFPDRSGFSYFLIDTPPDRVGDVSTLLEDRLSEFGFDVAPTAQVLAGFLAIENTYLSTFQMLGGLGLLLGTLGLGIILVRNTNERRGELATLRAYGFLESRISGMIFAEHSLLLALGILLGAVAALLAVAPHIVTNGGDVPWFSLLAVLLGILLVGMIATAVAVKLAMRRPLLSELRQE
ncbi:MAG: FtsX-like permease family protein [Acidobacteriota bacterium]|nr:MAG: FtsX-like permease family protein [Acidobacteriota bacterium]